MSKVVTCLISLRKHGDKNVIDSVEGINQANSTNSCGIQTNIEIPYHTVRM
jgi:hypothetical protein